MSRQIGIMKIALTTWLGRDNYGTTLQAYALFRFLSGLYGSCDFLAIQHLSLEKQDTWPRRWLALIWRKSGLKRFFYIRRHSQDIFFEKLEKIQRFQSEKITRIITPNTLDELQKILDRYDFIITGSDQIWNPFVGNFIFQLPFPCKARKIAFASSLGVSELPVATREIYKKNLGDFYRISCREKTGSYVLSKILHRKIEVMPDPTLLLTKEEWCDIAERSNLNTDNKVKKPYLLCYFIGINGEYWTVAKKLAKRLNLSSVVVIPVEKEHCKNPFYTIQHAGIEDFIYLLNNSAFILTDSFHMTIFFFFF